MASLNPDSQCAGCIRCTIHQDGDLEFSCDGPSGTPCNGFIPRHPEESVVYGFTTGPDFVSFDLLLSGLDRLAWGDFLKHDTDRFTVTGSRYRVTVERIEDGGQR